MSWAFTSYTGGNFNQLLWWHWPVFDRVRQHLADSCIFCALFNFLKYISSSKKQTILGLPFSSFRNQSAKMIFHHMVILISSAIWCMCMYAWSYRESVKHLIWQPLMIWGSFYCAFSHVNLSAWVKCQCWCFIAKMDKSTMLAKLSKFITLDVSWKMHLPAGNINATFALIRQLALPFLPFW